MQYFNIYQGSQRINKHPLTSDEIDKIKKSPSIKKIDSSNNMVEIPLSKIRVVKCTII